MKRVFLSASLIIILFITAAVPTRPVMAASFTTDLSTLYSLYIEVKRCWEFRRDAALVLISDVEMERARKAIKEIETEIFKSMDVDVQQAWKAASARAQDYRDRESCKTRYGFLTNSYKQLLPERNITIKDF